MLGPINAYKSFVSLVLGIFLLGEVPTSLGLAGMVLILAGSVIVFATSASGEVGLQTEARRMPRWTRDPGVRFRFAALALSATEAVFLKRALIVSSPLTAFVFWSVLGLPIAAVAIAMLLRAGLRAAECIAPHALAHLSLARADDGNHAVDDTLHLRAAAGRSVTRALSTLRPYQRVPWLQVLPGAAHTPAASGCRRDGRWRRDDRGLERVSAGADTISVQPSAISIQLSLVRCPVHPPK